MQPKNHLCTVFFFVLLVTLVSIGLMFADGSWRPMDIISDLRKSPTKDIATVSLSDSSQKTAIQADPDTIIYDDELGFTRFEDFSENRNGLGLFFEKLSNVASLGRPVRIAYIGDSLIEGDILSGDLRHRFQENFGGSGVGMMPVTSHVNHFRKTVIHQFKAWNAYNFKNYDKSKLGLGGIVCTPNKNAWVYYEGVKIGRLDSCKRVSVFYSLPHTNTRVFYKKDKGTSYYAALPKAESVGRIDIDGNCGNIQISFPPIADLHVYGVSLEDTTGVVVDNYSIRGFSGTDLKELSSDKLSHFNNLLNYDLIILGFGLNVTEPYRVDYQAYETAMVQTIDFLKASFPSASFLLVGIPDRNHKNGDNYETMPGVLAMIEHQKRICQKSGIVYWDLFEAMGGKNSMPLFVNSNPPKANKDYTHMTFDGGRYLGNLMYETFMHEKTVYARRSLQTSVK